MGIFDGLKNIKIFEDETPTKKEEVKPAEAPPPIMAQQQAVPAVPGSANDELANTLMKVVETKLSDNAYFKLKASMDAMIAKKVDMRSAALGSAAVLSLDAQAVTDSIAQVITALVTEQQNFANNDYASAKSNVESMNAHVAELEAQINELLEKVKTLSEERVSTQEAASKALGEAEMMSASFNATVSHLSNLLASEQQKLSAFLS